MKKIQFTTVQIIMLTFLAAILVGGLLLMLPISTATGEWCPFINALFTSTTSVCVTGLVVVDTYSYWSVFGKVVILLLIQIGGFSVVIIWARIMLFRRKNVSMRSRMLVRDYFNLDSMLGLSDFMKKVISGTLIVEGVGAFLFALVLVPKNGVIKGLCQSVFTSVSAFCNAGIDIFGPDSLIPFQKNVAVNLITMALIIMGGLGFIVWFDVLKTRKECRKKKTSFRFFLGRLSEHTKLVLSATLFLIISGALIVFIGEFNNPKTLGEMSFGNKVMASLFQSVTFRTAGFATVPQQDLSPFTCVAGLFYMLIGGSPTGTAGGIKTVTAAVMFLNTLSYIRQKNEIEVFGRRITPRMASRAIAVFMISFGMTIGFTELLLLTNNVEPLAALYEIFSATGTVGLSRALTPTLNSAGKVIVICSMYVGRIAPISMVLFFAGGNKTKNNISYPDGKFLIG